MAQHIVGVFDSGVGGRSVVWAIEKFRPDIRVIFANDSEHVPYGTRSPQEVLGFVVPILQGLVEQGCQTIIIACNTVTTTLIEQLRTVIDVPLIGMEPMVKPAALATKNGVIAVCATPATLHSDRYKWLKHTYAKNIKVVEPDCSDWSKMIEADQLDHKIIEKRIGEVLKKGADVIVLGCTHYHWIEDDIKKIVGGKAQVLQPEKAVITQLATVLATKL